MGYESGRNWQVANDQVSGTELREETILFEVQLKKLHI
jgi:hypothetical protein